MFLLDIQAVAASPLEQLALRRLAAGRNTDLGVEC